MDDFKKKIQNRLNDRHIKAKGSWKKLLIKILALILIIIIIKGFSGERFKAILSFGKSTEINGSNE
ncbi:MAG: hypothetical protein JXR56_01685 [Candidatus Cloacimonetes bacterium]|nr:hypothetical protein [Candidatus Cloacimonadota bacterium]